jgi:hypothetical protein
MDAPWRRALRIGALGKVKKRAPVGHARQHVGGGQALQLALQVLALRHVAVNALHTGKLAVVVEQGVAADRDVDHAPILAHHLPGKVRYFSMRCDRRFEGVAVTALRVIRFGGVALDFVRLVAQHPAHARAHVLHHALGVGAVVHVLHALEKAPEVLLALAQLLLDFTLVCHVHAAHQHGGRAVHVQGDARDQHHAQVAPAGVNAKF